MELIKCTGVMFGCCRVGSHQLECSSICCILCFTRLSPPQGELKNSKEENSLMLHIFKLKLFILALLTKHFLWFEVTLNINLSKSNATP